MPRIIPWLPMTNVKGHARLELKTMFLSFNAGQA